VLAFSGAADRADWLDDNAALALLQAWPDANISAEQAGEFIGRVIAAYPELEPHLDEVAQLRAAELLAAHQRVRRASKLRNVQYRVEPQFPPDVLGIYVYLPKV
jgi:hypothetical protein